MGLLDFIFAKGGVPEVLVEHFKMLHLDNTELIVNIDGESREFASVFLGLSGEAGNYDGLLIDSLLPQTGNKFIAESKKVKVQYRFRGAEYHFFTNYVDSNVGKFDAIKVEVPKKIIKSGGSGYERGSYRAVTALHDPCFVTLGKSEEKLIDISTGGFSFLTRMNLEHFRTDKIPLPVTVSIPSKNFSFETEVQVCHFVFGAVTVNNVAMNKCAASFGKLRFRDEEAIAQYVMERQRESLQKTKSG